MATSPTAPKAAAAGTANTPQKAANREAVIGGVVLLALLAIVGLNAVRQHTGGDGHSGFVVEAVFPQANGVTVGTEVRLSGVPVGVVVAQSLDGQFQSHTSLLIDTALPIPTDSAVTVETDGLLGAKYIAVQAGANDESWKAGSHIERGLTQGSLSLQDLLSRIVGQAQARRLSPKTP